MRRPSPRLVPYATIAALGLLTAVAAHRPEPALMVMPFAAVVVLSVLTAGPLTLEGSIAVPTVRSLVGDEITIELVIRAPHGAPWIEVGLDVPKGMTAVRWSDGPTLRLARAAPTTVTVVLRCGRWGAFRPGRATLVAFDRFRLFSRETVVAVPDVVRVHPPTDELRRLTEPRWLQGLAGAHRSRDRGDGIEYAETRPWSPGDRLRAVNWKVSAKRGTWHVSDRHPDRSADVVLLLDSFADTGQEPDTTLALAVEAAIGLADSHLRVQDRVGLVGIGGYLDWLLPDLGARQLHRVVDAVLDTQVVVSLADRSLAIVPPLALPPRSLVVALTPLVDPRSAGLLARVRGRGCDLTVIEVSPAPFLDPPTTTAERLGFRVWEVEREIVRRRLRAIGATVVAWPRGRPFADVMAEVVTWRARFDTTRAGRR